MWSNWPPQIHAGICTNRENHPHVQDEPYALEDLQNGLDWYHFALLNVLQFDFKIKMSTSDLLVFIRSNSFKYEYMRHKCTCGYAPACVWQIFVFTCVFMRMSIGKRAATTEATAKSRKQSNNINNKYNEHWITTPTIFISYRRFNDLAFSMRIIFKHMHYQRNWPCGWF